MRYEGYDPPKEFLFATVYNRGFIAGMFGAGCGHNPFGPPHPCDLDSLVARCCRYWFYGNMTGQHIRLWRLNRKPEDDAINC